MLYTSLSAFVNNLSEHLQLGFQLSDSPVILGKLGDNNKLSSANKIVVSLANVEKETAVGIQFNYKSASPTQYKKLMPAWQLNLFILIVAAFSEKQYEEGLQLFSAVLFYLQNNYTFSIVEYGRTLTIEPVNLSMSELSNLWSICGGSYYPSVMCKIRMVDIAADEIKAMKSKINRNELDI